MKYFLPLLLCSLFVLNCSKAEELTLRYQAVMHTTEQHTIPILEQPKHLMGVAKFQGLAIFTDGEIVDHRYEGSFEVNPDSGTRFRGYALWRFNDGAKLQASYEGDAVQSGDGIKFEAVFLSFSGTARLAGVSGSGVFQGRRYDRLNSGGSTYAAGELQLTLPE